MKKAPQKAMIAGLLIMCAGATANSVELTPNTIALMSKLDATKAPSENFDLTKWKINIPMEDDDPDRAGKVMEVSKTDLNDHDDPYTHPDWFYTNKETGAMVFATPNKAMTTKNSKNARTELRAMLDYSAKAPSNNFVISAHPEAEEYGAIGGNLSATLSVDWVSTSGSYKKNGAFSVIVGQIHGSRNEPLKIAYRKLPGHQHGSLFWRYEINALGDNYSKRHDKYHNVFGEYNLRESGVDPVDGIKLGEVFSYEVNVEGNIMSLTFIKNIGEENEIVKTASIDLSKPHYQGSEYDEGYANDWMYFKAGNYNQCNTGSSKCSNNGKEAGDYAQVSFYQLVLNQ